MYALIAHMTPLAHTAYVGLGANLGDRRVTLVAARDRLAADLELLACSRLYETPPWGLSDQPPFLNAVCQVRTALAPRELLIYLKQIEQDLGRTPTLRWGPRVIDLDILLYDDLVYLDEQLAIPHPRLPERAFALIPLCELAPGLFHPALNQRFTDLVAALPPTDITPIGEQW